MSKTTPTQRSLAHFKKHGWTAGVVEKWVTVPSHPAGGVRRDFCGGIDLIAFRELRPISPGLERLDACGILGVQCCAASGLAAHRDKLLAEPRMREWVLAGGRLVIHAWRKTNDRKAGKRKLWNLNEVEVLAEHFPANEQLQTN